MRYKGDGKDKVFVRAAEGNSSCVIADLVRTETHILTVHDSFIVPIGEEDKLNQLMKEAFKHVTHKLGIKKVHSEPKPDTTVSSWRTRQRLVS